MQSTTAVKYYGKEFDLHVVISSPFASRSDAISRSSIVQRVGAAGDNLGNFLRGTTKVEVGR